MVLVATAITVLVGFCALTIDLGSMYLVRTELQRAADAAALAGVTQLTPYQEGLTEAAVKAEAERLVEANPVQGKTVRLDLARLSDGQANVTKTGTVNDYEGGKAYALQEAQRAVNLGIQFHCVSVGFDSDRPFMQQIAQMGKGKEFFASGTIDEYSSELMAIFAELSSKRPIRLIE